MPRPPRIQANETIYHLTTRSTRRTALFRDDVDRMIFLATLATVISRHRWTCFGYCLMTTHYHVLIQTGNDGELAAAMLRLNGLYARSFNRRHGERGHVFDARYRSPIVETDSHLLEACRYIAMNPVWAGLCVYPEDWFWSSYGISLGLRPAPDFFRPSTVLRLFGDGDRAREAWQRFVEAAPTRGDASFTVPGTVKGTPALLAPAGKG